MNKSELIKTLQAHCLKSNLKDKLNKVALFGSYVRNEQKPESDIDLLVELKEPVGLLEFLSIEQELSSTLGKKVDLCTYNSLSKFFRDDVLNEQEVVYEI